MASQSEGTTSGRSASKRRSQIRSRRLAFLRQSAQNGTFKAQVVVLATSLMHDDSDGLLNNEHDLFVIKGWPELTEGMSFEDYGKERDI